MDDARWNLIDQVLGEALEQPASERASFLDGRCTGDAALRRAVDRLLRLEQEASGALPALVTANEGDRTARIGVIDQRKIGPYRLVHPLGHGGMGSVYLARREEGYEQEVAIKLVRTSWRDSELRRRFVKERQILARLEHPHIARLYDGGTTDDGLPYLVMERVVGLPIDRFCHQNQLSLQQIVRLVVTVCRAVDVAHAQALVHCDLKPNNILVTADGMPKLLDFGIAKILASGEDSATLTRPGARPLTPSYASPEQLTGQPICTASDVFSLGVLLYRLVCGHKPFRSIASVADAIDPSARILPKPSRRVLEPTKRPLPSGASPRQLAKLLRGDLDAILAMTLRHAAAERYASAGALAEDLQNYLDALPVSARTPPWSSRGRPWWRRLNQPASSAHRLERLLWLGLVVVAVALLPRALDPSAEGGRSASGAVRHVIGEMPPIEVVMEDVAWIQPIDNSHLTDALIARARSEFRLQRHAAARAIRVAKTTTNQHLLTEALLLEAEALDILGQPAEADRALAEAVRVFTARDDGLGLARASLIFRHAADPDRRPVSLEEALELFRARGHHAGEALALVRVGKSTIQRDLHRARAMMGEGLHLAEAIGAWRIQAEAWSSLASLSVALNAIEEADVRFATAVRFARRLGDRRLITGYLLNRAWARAVLGDLDAHDSMVEEASDLARQIDHGYLLVSSLTSLARSRHRRGDAATARRLHDESYRAALDLGDAVAIDIARGGLIDFHRSSGEYRDALALMDQVIEHARVSKPWTVASFGELESVSLLVLLGRPDEAEPRLRRIQEEAPTLAEEGRYLYLSLQLRWIDVRRAQGRVDEARALLERYLVEMATDSDVEMQRYAARLVAQLDKAPGGGELTAMLIGEERRARSLDDWPRALLLGIGVGRVEWFQGDRSAAEARFVSIASDATARGLELHQAIAASEARGLVASRHDHPP